MREALQPLGLAVPCLSVQICRGITVSVQDASYDTKRFQLSECRTFGDLIQRLAKEAQC